GCWSVMIFLRAPCLSCAFVHRSVCRSTYRSDYPLDSSSSLFTAVKKWVISLFLVGKTSRRRRGERSSELKVRIPEAEQRKTGNVLKHAPGYSEVTNRGEKNGAIC
ncbi:MAG: hypothetical protein D3922_13835, partial [Candidatus Electrothrix sp. AR1]|nr:hypothetical protein [Candidatus Electrothrix sp. AR1]